MWKPPSKAIANRSILPHGTDPGLQRSCRSGTSRQKRPADALNISAKTGETEIGLSVVTLIELAHGAARADTPERKAKRRQFIQELQVALPIHLVTATLAVRAGELDGENQARGVRLPLADLLIGVTSLPSETMLCLE
jgi:predicted nucleic acid-binding protein